MKMTPRIAMLAVAALATSSAFASDHLRFDGAVGVDPFRSAGGVAVLNTVLGVPPGGAPWTIRSLRADIRSDGRISARGEGLLLSGGDNFGNRGGPRKVLASLFCRAAPVGTATTGAAIGPFNSEFVDLDANGDFQIRSSLRDSTGAPPPSPCGDIIDNRPVLLIRTVAGTPAAPGSWFAGGILKGDLKDD